jgi:lipid II:glycine glycyltransferase (peptidoglycan interpeptide bridge formation enzyme)
MKIQEISDQNGWNIFIDVSGSLSFLQSWEWGEFQKKMGQHILRLGVYEKNTIVALALVEKMNSKRGRYLFVPHGPITKSVPALTALRNYLIDLAKREGYEFIRIGPVMDNNSENLKLFRDLGFKMAPIYLHSEDFWMLPLDKSEDELLVGMRKTTRYLIRKAVRDGVTIEKRTDEKAVEDFYKIYEKTVERERFSPYSEKFIKYEFEAFGKENNALFFFGKHDENILASALVLFTKSGAFYHQGASIHSKIPVPYLLQWEVIKEAKRRGCNFYNFWGILISGRTPKAWEGLTTFKTGFGGYEYKCVPTQDYIISLKYYFTYLYEKFLQWKRGV